MSPSVTACWKTRDARDIFVTEALEGNDAIFLATHSPIQGFGVLGRDAGEITESTDQCALEVLSDPDREHAFCVVQGEPGSGKSHLIRWLSVNWSNTQDICLLLRRADGSLEGALRQLKSRLPEEFSALFDNLGRVQRASLQGRANIFLSTLVNTLEPDHFEQPLEDDEWCRQHRPDEILARQSVKEHWEAPKRILNLLEGAGGARNSESASFNIFDIVDLVSVPVPKGLSNIKSAGQLFTRLKRESADIQAYRKEGWLPGELAQQYAEEFPNCIALMDALNRRRNEAIQNVLGVSAQALKTLFRKVREALAERGKRLVLFLEDITSWEGLDDSLIDVLVFNASARGDQDKPVCPLVSVVGVTPDYYEKLAGNYRQRITHEICLGEATEGLQDVATIRESGARRRFIVKYLAAVRAGKDGLEKWASEGVTNFEASPPNPCSMCPRREGCFTVFGSEGGIGLFPFTERSLDRFFDALKDNDNGQTWKTPRGILQAILNTNLGQADALNNGEYPGAAVESGAFRQDRTADYALSRLLEQIVENKIDDPIDVSRAKRLLAYWGDPSSTETTTENGSLSFAKVPQGIFDAFNIPWLGSDNQTSHEGDRPKADKAYKSEGASGPIVQDETPVEEPQEKITEDPISLPIAENSPRSKPKPKRLTQNKGTMEKMREEVRNWASGRNIDNANQWNKLLYELIRKLDCRPSGYARPLVNKVVTSEMVKLAGTFSGNRDYLVIEPDSWVTDGFESYLELRTRNDLSQSDMDFHRRKTALLMRGLERQVLAYLSRRVPKLDDGVLWEPASTIAQILMARAWLRGTITTDTPIAEQLNILLSDEGDPIASVQSRSSPWQDWLNATNRSHDALRSELRNLISLPQGEGSAGASLIDSSQIVAALTRFADTAKFDLTPQVQSSLPDPYRRALELAELWKQKRVTMDRTEASQISNRAEQLEGLMRGQSISAHFERLDRCIVGISELLPTASSDQVRDWKEKYEPIKEKLTQNVGKSVENLIIALDDDKIPSSIARRMCWLAAAPTGELAFFLQLAQLGEKVVSSLRDHARDCVNEASGVGSLNEVKRNGQKLWDAIQLNAEVGGTK